MEFLNWCYSHENVMFSKILIERALVVVLSLYRRVIVSEELR